MINFGSMKYNQLNMAPPRHANVLWISLCIFGFAFNIPECAVVLFFMKIVIFIMKPC